MICQRLTHPPVSTQGRLEEPARVIRATGGPAAAFADQLWNRTDPSTAPQTRKFDGKSRGRQGAVAIIYLVKQTEDVSMHNLGSCDIQYPVYTSYADEDFILRHGLSIWYQYD